MIPINNFSDHYKGDTFLTKNINFGFDVTGAEITLEFKTQVNTRVAFFWSTTDDSISIVDAINGSVNMNSKNIDVTAATYMYDCQINFANGRVKTYFKGTLTIVQDITA